LKTITAFMLGTLLLTAATIGYAQELSDGQIQSAIERGNASSAKKIWQEIEKKQQVRVNRAGFDPIEKKVTSLFASDRIALEAAEATRQMRSVNVAEIRTALASPVIEVLLEANCYNNNYAGFLPKWGPNGGVHLVREVNGEIPGSPCFVCAKPMGREVRPARPSMYGMSYDPRKRPEFPVENALARTGT
jgi:hypothetical protein